MSRRHAAEKRKVLPDPKYGDLVITRLMNRLMLDGKKSVAEKIVYGAFDDMEKKGRCDLIHDLAEPVPAIVIAELLGVPAEDHRQFREWSSALIAGIGAGGAKEMQVAARLVWCPVTGGRT